MKISRLMLGHHLTLEKLLNNFSANLGNDFEAMSGSLEELKRGMERHFSAEEEQIFSASRPDDEGIIEARTTKRLIREHGHLLEMLNDLKNELAIKDMVDISDFRDFLVAHRHFEERYVYPKLDKKLSEEEKRLIINRISGIL